MMKQEAENRDAIVSFCNDLLGFEHVAISGYATAIDGLKDYPAIAQMLQQFRGDHDRHVRELEGYVRGCGGEPRTTPAISVVFRKPLMEVKKLQGGQAILGGMVSNEESACEQYDWAQGAAREKKFPQDVVDLCRLALEDERRHLAYCVEQYESFKTGTRVGTEARRPRAAGGPAVTP